MDKEKNTHLILKYDDIDNALSKIDRTELEEVVKAVRDYRLAKGLDPNPKYHLCNKDESYSNLVLDVILSGEGKFSPVYSFCVYFAIALNDGDIKLVKAEFEDCHEPFTDKLFNKIKLSVLNGYKDDKGREALKISTITQKEYLANTSENGTNDESTTNLHEAKKTTEFDREIISR